MHLESLVECRAPHSPSQELRDDQQTLDGRPGSDVETGSVPEADEGETIQGGQHFHRQGVAVQGGHWAVEVPVMSKGGRSETTESNSLMTIVFGGKKQHG